MSLSEAVDLINELTEEATKLRQQSLDQCKKSFFLFSFLILTRKQNSSTSRNELVC